MPESKSDKVAEAIASGRLWRAKEILGGRIRSMPYAPDMYEQFGQLLLRMGDDLQAGKFLFLSGRRNSEYEAAIRLFVSRYSRADWQSFVSSFPAAVRRCSWSELPERVQHDLIGVGVPRRPAEEPLSKTLSKYPRGHMGWKGCLLLLLVLIGIGLLVSVVVVYFYER